jgi:hypothetical protein
VKRNTTEGGCPKHRYRTSKDGNSGRQERSGSHGQRVGESMVATNHAGLGGPSARASA